MAWPGWDTYVPPKAALPTGSRSHAKPHKYRARPVLVGQDGTLYEKETIEALADGQGVTRVSAKGTRRPLVALAKLVGIEGVYFQSRKEAKTWVRLMQQERRGDITNLRRQVAFPLLTRNPQGLMVVVGQYVADFVYDELERQVVHDCKGMRTDLYLWKKHHFEAQYGERIRET
jgi:hypothetical protein